MDKFPSKVDLITSSIDVHVNNYCQIDFKPMKVIKLAASWRKRLGTRLPPLGSRVCVSVPPCGFRGGQNRVWVGFSRGFSRFPLPPISFHHFLHPHLIHFVSFHPPLWWCIRRGRPAPLLLTDLYCRGFIASHPSTRPCVGHELRIFIYI